MNPIRVPATVEFTDADRALVARFLGRDGLASSIECTAWAKHAVRSQLTVMASAPPRPLAPGNRIVTEWGHESREGKP